MGTIDFGQFGQLFYFLPSAPAHIGLVEHTVTPDQDMRANCPFIRYATLGKLSPFWSRKTPNKENAMNATEMPITCLSIMNRLFGGELTLYCRHNA